MNSHRLFKVLTYSLLCLSVGCSDYQGISPTAYQYAKALYNVTNRKRSEKLDQVSDLIAVSRQDGQITEQEVEWLERIIEDARDGDWQTAQKTARQMMSDQVQ
ncbi:MAG: hypothetical protein P8M53_13330 [Pirellulales bacterium]|nr:hypothetical protein [Pirellulales bacterium]